MLVEQTGFKINYDLSHTNVLIKVTQADQPKTILYTKNVLQESEKKGDFCLAKTGKYVFNIESACHKFTNNQQDLDFVLIDSVNFFKKNPNHLKLNAVKNRLTVDVLFKTDESNGSPRPMNQEDVQVEVLSADNKQIDVIKFGVKSKTKNEIVFTGTTWVQPNQFVKLVAKSNKILFEEGTKEIEVNANNCDLNRVEFEGKLGIFIHGSIKPANIDSIDLTLKSTDDNAVLTQSVINAEKGFKLGPLKSPFSKYTVELSKVGYLFNKVCSYFKFLIYSVLKKNKV
jgi:hypothetical protein